MLEDHPSGTSNGKPMSMQGHRKSARHLLDPRYVDGLHQDRVDHSTCPQVLDL